MQASGMSECQIMNFLITRSISELNTHVSSGISLSLSVYIYIYIYMVTDAFHMMRGLRVWPLN